MLFVFLPMSLKELFYEELAYRPYCSDELDFGLKIRDKSIAKNKKFIQANPPDIIKWICFDIDYPHVLETTFQEKFIPAPNFMIENPLNQHSHLIYGLNTGVCCSENGHSKPLNYLAAIEFSLGNLLKADRSYGGFITKNPLHNFWSTKEIEKSLWDMGQLCDFLTLPKKLPSKSFFEGMGRNCHLFEIGRKFSYQNVEFFRDTEQKELFFNAIFHYLQIHNSKFPKPLFDTEIKSISKSISNWTWKNYQKKISDEEWQKYVKETHTKEIQSKRGKISGKVRFEGSNEQIKPWEKLGISRAWYYKQKKDLKENGEIRE